MKLLIELPEDVYISVCNESMLPPDVTNVLNAIKGGQPFFKNATNGDMIKAMLPVFDVKIEGSYVTCLVGEDKWIGFSLDCIEFSLDWWNAPYKGVEE